MMKQRVEQRRRGPGISRARRRRPQIVEIMTTPTEAMTPILIELNIHSITG